MCDRCCHVDCDLDSEWSSCTWEKKTRKFRSEPLRRSHSVMSTCVVWSPKVLWEGMGVPNLPGIFRSEIYFQRAEQNCSIYDKFLWNYKFGKILKNSKFSSNILLLDVAFRCLRCLEYNFDTYCFSQHDVQKLAIFPSATWFFEKFLFVLLNNFLWSPNHTYFTSSFLRKFLYI